MFYMPRLFIYGTEAEQQPGEIKTALRQQLGLMSRRLWLGITWPSALLTLVLGPWLWWLMGSFPQWLLIKLIFVLGLYAYHLSIHFVYRQQQKVNLSIQFTAVADLELNLPLFFFFAIVFIATVKNSLSWIWSLLGLSCFIIILLAAIRIYKIIRARQK